MQANDRDAEGLVTAGIRALQQNRPDEARRHLEAATATGRAGARAWFLLAFACRAQKDEAAEERALDRLLDIEPTAHLGLIMKADCRVRAGDDSAAVDLYKNALRAVRGRESSLSPADIAELQRAETVLKDLDARHAAQLEAKLAELGFPAEQRSPRFQRSLDIMAGRKQAYFQDPRGYYFPELPQIQFYDPADFDWAPAIEAATDVIRDELSAVLAGGLEGFVPYIRTQAYEPRDHPLLDNFDWSVLFLCENGKRFEDAIARCPRTWEALQAVPLTWIERSSPTIMFSVLRGGARITPHHGVHNTRLICHLPLIVPPGCGFRVGNEVRQWEPGKLLIFDDSMEHEAWNESDEDRVVLIFDVWRPELNEQERQAVAAMFLTSIV